MSRWIYCFQPRFAELVANGAKTQTIRANRKDGRFPVAGDVLSLRAWSGKPYRSKQRQLRPECPCVASSEILIISVGVVETKSPWVRVLDNDQLDVFAKADGFADFAEMVAWFDETHGLPFSGVLIGW